MEDSVVTMNVFHHVAWGTTISVYFWLVGASAGSFVISSFGWVFGIKRYKPLTMTASVTAPPAASIRSRLAIPARAAAASARYISSTLNRTLSAGKAGLSLIRRPSRRRAP